MDDSTMMKARNARVGVAVVAIALASACATDTGPDPVVDPEKGVRRVIDMVDGATASIGPLGLSLQLNVNPDADIGTPRAGESVIANVSTERSAGPSGEFAYMESTRKFYYSEAESLDISSLGDGWSKLYVRFQGLVQVTPDGTEEIDEVFMWDVPGSTLEGAAGRWISSVPTPAPTPTGGCGSDDECGMAEVCVAEACVAWSDGCMSEFDCEMGESCVDGGCAEGGADCMSEFDCEMGESCVDGGCVTGAGGENCTNTCEYAHDMECDDGGPGALYDACALGTDCADCGGR